MRTYSEEFKAQIVAQILPPHNRGIPELVKETGIPKDTLYTWRSKHRGMQEAATPQGKGADGFTSAEKFQWVVESAALNADFHGEKSINISRSRVPHGYWKTANRFCNQGIF